MSDRANKKRKTSALATKVKEEPATDESIVKVVAAVPAPTDDIKTLCSLAELAARLRVNYTSEKAKLEALMDRLDNKARTAGAMTVFIISLTGSKKDIAVPMNATVARLKDAIETRDGIPPDDQRLIFEGQALDDRRELSTYGISSGSMVHLVLRLRGC